MRLTSCRLLTALASCVALAHAVHASDHTHIDNHSKWTIIATTSYPGGKSEFNNRKIPPGGSDVDTYSYVDNVNVVVQVDGAPFNNWFKIASDDSVVAEDTPGNEYGVDFWVTDGDGKAIKTNPLVTEPDTPWPPLVTIFGPGPPSTPSPSPSPPASPSPAIVPRSTPYWGKAADEGCKSPGYRQMSARLWGSSSRSNWNADCKATPFSPNKYETLSGDDTSCADTGVLDGERGTWKVYDKECLPYWGSFKDDGCKSKGFRQYSSVLYKIPSGQSWENWCKYFPADIKGVGDNTQHFYQPDRCKASLNMWGEFDYPDNSCCGNDGKAGARHDELAGAGSRKLLVFPPRCDALAGPALPITAAAFLLALLHSARDVAEIQLRNTAIQALQPPRNSAGRNPRTSTRFWERDVFVPGSNNRQFRGNFRVPVFQAFPANAPPVNPSDYLPSQSEAFDATWVPRYMAGVGPLRTPSFTLPNQDGVIYIPRSAYVTIDASGPDVLLTAQLTGCAFVWAYDSVNRVLYAAHINPDPDRNPATQNRNVWARTGDALANELTLRARFAGTELTVNVYGRNGFGYTGTNGNIMAIRNGNGWEVIAQTLGVERSVPTDIESVDYDNVQ
ncbi:hypothetical protein WJX74_002991 [Apatococcus lobatus]|uniref:Uncharacterized protein n=2 Tax=Apatococcus TaxID=904362 RepID=A0AAW1SJC8_9CHLO